jgi:protein-disulfide isomerase
MRPGRDWTITSQEPPVAILLIFGQPNAKVALIERFADIIQRSLSEANTMQISGTPTFIIGTLDDEGNVISVKQAVVGAWPFESFRTAIDPLLASGK